MTPFRIHRTTTYVKDLLRGKDMAYVHSIYKNTVNLSIPGDGNEMIALQTYGSALSPMSLILGPSEDISTFPYSVGETVSLVQLISLSNAKITDLKLHGKFFWDTATLNQLLEQVIETLKKSKKKDGFIAFFPDPDKSDLELPLLMDAARKKISQIIKDIYAGTSHQELADGLSSMIGLGMGLTPSGDDFLTGVLSAFALTGSKDSLLYLKLSNAIYENMDRTLDISQAFLRLALIDEFSEPILLLQGAEHMHESADSSSPQNASSTLLSSKDQTAMIARAFGGIGHSSGTDTLCGIYFATKYLIK